MIDSFRQTIFCIFFSYTVSTKTAMTLIYENASGELFTATITVH